MTIIINNRQEVETLLGDVLKPIHITIRFNSENFKDIVYVVDLNKAIDNEKTRMIEQLLHNLNSFSELEEFYLNGCNIQPLNVIEIYTDICKSAIDDSESRIGKDFVSKVIDINGDTIYFNFKDVHSIVYTNAKDIQEIILRTLYIGAKIEQEMNNQD